MKFKRWADSRQKDFCNQIFLNEKCFLNQSRSAMKSKDAEKGWFRDNLPWKLQQSQPRNRKRFEREMAPDSGVSPQRL